MLRARRVFSSPLFFSSSWRLGEALVQGESFCAPRLFLCRFLCALASALFWQRRQLVLVCGQPSLYCGGIENVCVVVVVLDLVLAQTIFPHHAVLGKGHLLRFPDDV